MFVNTASPASQGSGPKIPRHDQLWGNKSSPWLDQASHCWISAATPLARKETGYNMDLIPFPHCSPCSCHRWHIYCLVPHLHWSQARWVCGGVCEVNLTHVGHGRGGCVAGCARKTSPALVTGEVGVWQGVQGKPRLHWSQARWMARRQV